MYLLHFVFCSTPYYIIEFLIVKRGGVDDSYTNGSQVSVAGMQFIYKGCDMDEKKVHMILEFESMEKGGEWLTRPDILQKRIEAGADVESTEIIPLKD